MFQLILGISLGIILLFVLLLLVTEVAATYPVWKHFYKKEPAFTEPSLQPVGRRNGVTLWMLVLVALLLVCLIAYFIGSQVVKQNSSTMTAENGSAEKNVYTKLLSGSDVARLYFFRLQTKWQDGKMYGNNHVTFHRDTALSFTDCRYHLLDRDGFLITEILFSPDDFVYTIGTTGRITGLSSKFNTPVSLQDYQKIEKLQVVLDKKLVVQ